MKLLLLILLSGCAIFEKGGELIVEGLEAEIKGACKEKKCPVCPRTEVQCFIVKKSNSFLSGSEEKCFEVVKEEKE